uniref:Large ribosomal subunit protein bL20c n=1 Tax=Glycine max TaxID=3847 RepID=A0A0R0FPA4_SOYBN
MCLYIARKRTIKIHLFTSSFRGTHSSFTGTITQKKIKALISIHWDKDRKKRDFRGLCISRINAVILCKIIDFGPSDSDNHTIDPTVSNIFFFLKII